MLSDTPIIATLTAGLVLAFVAGFIAIRLRLPPIVGYLLAGVAIGPFTPGYTGDVEIASELSEIGVILLMFGVGVHFSVRDLLSVRNIAIPGALGRIAGATAIATAVAMWWGLSWGEGMVLGLAVSIASTVVLLRALEDRNALTTAEGRIAVGWLIVEDLFTVMALVFVPIVATSLGGTIPDDAASERAFPLAVTFALGKIALLIAVMAFIAARAIPWLLLQVARTGSRELFTLAVLAAALGIAFASAYFFDVSLALGAFLAGLVVAQSAQSHQAAADALPLRDAFAVLFFVSVGMLFDPAIIVDEPLKLALLVALIVVGKSLMAFGIVIAFGHAIRSALVIAASLAQIGEFSFILADVGRDYDLVSEETNNLILGAALISISINPLAFLAIDPLERWLGGQRLTGLRRPRDDEAATLPEPAHFDLLAEHTVICGGGAVGVLVATALQRHGVPYVIVERDQRRVEVLRERGMHAVFGDAANYAVLEGMRLDAARVLVVATPEAGAGLRIVDHARRLNPNLQIVARTGTAADRASLLRQGVQDEDVAVSDVEVGLTMIRRSLIRAGIDDDEGLETLRHIRQETRILYGADED